MTTHGVPSVGGKDLQDFKGLSRVPEIGFLQKQNLPNAPRENPAVPEPTVFQMLKTFATTNYLAWIVEYLRYRIGRKHPFPSYDSSSPDSGIYPLQGDRGKGDDTIRIAIAGDWGTGTDEAFKIAELMKKRLPHYTVHLGDVYFVGDPGEVRENFLGIQNPKRSFTPCLWPAGSLGAFALNGNHEMYARGYGYFENILPALGMQSGGIAQKQKASFFCLENEYWRVIALDTGYNSIGLPLIEQVIQPDCALPDSLVTWLRDILHQKSDKRGIVLLGHHQYYSCYDDWYVRPAEQLAEFIDRPVIWLWGHEHRLAIYEKYQTGKGITAFGRCIGHGGMPVDLPPTSLEHTGCTVEFVDRRPYVNQENLKVGINGFAALTFDRSALEIEYVDVFDAVIFSESWIADETGNISRIASWALEAANSPSPS